MSLVGNLEDLPLTDILQIVSLSKRTGILTIETEEGKNIIVFKNGLIVSAACPSPKIKNLGQILLEKQMITQAKLQQLLDLQKTRGNEPLGSILVEAKVTDKESLQQMIKNQIKETIYHLMQTREGNFSFDLNEVIPFDEIRYNPLESVLERGLNPQQLLLDSVRIDDEQKRDEQRGKAKPVDFYSDMEIPVSPRAEESFADLPSDDEPVAEEKSLKLEDLQLPETYELPDIAFDQIANQIDFPLASSPASSSMTPIQPAPPVVVTTQRSILMVDDEALIRQVLAKRFEEKGFIVHQTDNAKDAIRIAGEAIGHREDLGVVCDLVMPTSVGGGFLGGLEVVEAIRRLDSTVPILVITDYDDSKAQTRAYSLGVHNFHKKPVLGKHSVQEAETQLHEFADSLLDAFQHPTHQFKTGEIQADFWSDLGIEQTTDDAPASAANMIRQMTALREIIQQLRNPNEAPEISLLILRYAAEFFDRGLLFLVKKDEVDGLGGFGDTGESESMPQKVRRIKIPLSEDSIFSRVVKRRQTHIGKLADTTTNRRFISMTGRLVPPGVAMLPLISGSEVIALLYGDNAATKRPIKDLEGLEIFMVQAGIAMENALLHRKIKTLKFK